MGRLEIQQEFKRLQEAQRRRSFGGIALALAGLGALRLAPPFLGRGLVVLCLAGLVGIVVATFRAWRCPACGRLLGKKLDLDECPRCGASFVP